jgi:hypothetical protein
VGHEFCHHPLRGQTQGVGSWGSDVIEAHEFAPPP